MPRSAYAVSTTHNITTIVRLVEAVLDGPVPLIVDGARKLSDCATATRYPNDTGVVPAGEHERGVELARAVLDWARSVVDG